VARGEDQAQQVVADVVVDRGLELLDLDLATGVDLSTELRVLALEK
jgi:hypothetical protein